MMRPRPLAALALAALLLLPACGGSGSDPEELINNPSDNLNKTGMPIAKEPITIKFMTGKPVQTAEDYNKVASWKQYEKMTNIHIEWGLTPKEGLDEKRNLALASGDYAGAIHTGSIPTLDVGKYGEQGSFLKLNSLIDQYMPNVKKLMEDNPQIKKGMTFPDGSIYSLPSIHDPEFTSLRTQFKLWVRQDWLDALGMKVPTTTQEYYEYLKAVKTKDPNGNGKPDEIGYSDADKGHQLTNALKGSFGVGNRGTSQGYLDADPDQGGLRFFPTSDSYRDLLEYQNKLYQEGLIEKNIYSLDTSKYTNAASSGVYGSVITQSPTALYGAVGKNYVAVPALKGPKGEKSWNYLGSPLGSIGNFVITDSNEHPIETARWIDYFYGDEGSRLFFMGIEGESFQTNDKGEVEYLPKITDNPDGLTSDEALKPYVTYLGGGYPGVVKDAYFKGAENSPQAQKGSKILEADRIPDDLLWPAFTFTTDESQELAPLATDIEKFVGESQDKFISGKEPLSNWEAYVQSIDKMGLKDYLKIEQTAYERFAE